MAAKNNVLVFIFSGGAGGLHKANAVPRKVEAPQASDAAYGCRQLAPPSEGWVPQSNLPGIRVPWDVVRGRKQEVARREAIAEVQEPQIQQPEDGRQCCSAFWAQEATAEGQLPEVREVA